MLDIVLGCLRLIGGDLVSCFMSFVVCAVCLLFVLLVGFGYCVCLLGLVFAVIGVVGLVLTCDECFGFKWLGL